MVVMVTGVAGQLGHDVMNELVKRGHKCFGTDIDVFYRKKPDGTMISRLPYCSMDVSNLATVDRVIDSLRLDAVIHCAAVSDLEAVEGSESCKRMMKVNAKGTENVAITCKKFGVKLVYVSSASVYGGGGDELLDPDTSPTEPETVYGQSKLLGEKAVIEHLERYFIVRTQLLYGMSGENFARTLLEQGENNRSVRVAGNVVGTPTYIYDLARLLVDMVESEEYGIYNAVNEGESISLADFAGEIFRRAGLRTRVISVSPEKNVNMVKGPEPAKLSTDKLRLHHFRRLPPWKGATGRFLKEIKFRIRVRSKLETKEDLLRFEENILRDD